MTLTAHIFAIVASSLALIGVLLLLRRRSFRERHAMWWLFASIAAVIGSIWPNILDSVAAFLGVSDPLNLVAFLGLLTLFLVCVQFSSEITGLESRVRRLAEESAIMEQRIRALEARERR